MSYCNADSFNYFWICEPLAWCAKLGPSLPLGTPMEIDFTSAYVHYSLPQCSKIVTPIIFSITYELFRLPLAKVPQDYQLLRTLFWCLMEKLTRNNGPFLDTMPLTTEKRRGHSYSTSRQRMSYCCHEQDWLWRQRDVLVNDKQTYEELKLDPTPALQHKRNSTSLTLKKTNAIDTQCYYRLKCSVQ